MATPRIVEIRVREWDGRWNPDSRVKAVVLGGARFPLDGVPVVEDRSILPGVAVAIWSNGETREFIFTSRERVDRADD